MKTSPPTQIQADGMEMHLTREGAPGQSKSSGTGVNGVELVILKRNVEMQPVPGSAIRFPGRFAR